MLRDLENLQNDKTLKPLHRGKGPSKLRQLEYVTIEIQVSMGTEIGAMELASLWKLSNEGFEHKKQAIRKIEDREGGLRFGMNIG